MTTLIPIKLLDCCKKHIYSRQWFHTKESCYMWLIWCVTNLYIIHNYLFHSITHPHRQWIGINYVDIIRNVFIVFRLTFASALEVDDGADTEIRSSVLIINIASKMSHKWACHINRFVHYNNYCWMLCKSLLTSLATTTEIIQNIVNNQLTSSTNSQNYVGILTKKALIFFSRVNSWRFMSNMQIIYEET